MNAVEKLNSADLAVIDGGTSVAITPMAMIAQAVAAGADLTMIERLIALQERIEANDARKAFVAAMAEFKAAELTISKNKHVGFDAKSEGGGRVDYNHATLDNVCATVDPELAKVGLSYRWKTEQLDGGMIRVTCIMRHVLGHSEETVLQAGADQSGKKNNIQAVGSTVSYLSRYTLMAALGLASAEMDDDGISSEDRGTSTIDMDMVDRLRQGLEEAKADLPKFCKYMGVNCLADIKVSDLPKAWESINYKKMDNDKKGVK